MRKPLDKQSILEAAIAMADDDGLDSLSMRKLGQRLGVEAMSLYYHVPNKTALINEMVAWVITKMAPPPADLHWKEAIHIAARSSYEQLLLHPWATVQMLNPNMHNQKPRFAWMNGILGCFRNAGFSVKLTHHAYHALDSHILGFAFWASNLPGSREEQEEILQRVEPLLNSGDYPWLVEHIGYHRDHDGTDDDENEFDYTLGLILDGIERIFINEQR